MRAYCSTEILKSMISAGTPPDLIKADLAEDRYGHYTINYGGKVTYHQETYHLRDSKYRKEETIYALKTTEEQRMSRAAVKMADALLWALEEVERPKKKEEKK